MTEMQGPIGTDAPEPEAAEGVSIREQGDAPAAETSGPDRASGAGEAVEAGPSDARREAPEGARPDGTAPIDLADLPGGAGATGGGATLELLYDLSLPLTVELGRASMTVQEVLELGQGSVIRLDRVAGDPVDVYVGAKKLAQAEVVVLDDRFGIRITYIYPDAGTGGA